MIDRVSTVQFDFAALSLRDCYKLMVSTIVPRPIAWVVTQSAEGVVNAAPYSFFNGVAGDPPLLSISVEARADGSPKDTAVNIRESGQFVVNLVSAAVAGPMVVSAADFGAADSEVEIAGLTTAPSVRIKPPRIAESPVAFECETFQIVGLPGGRDLVIGRILFMHIDEIGVKDAARAYVNTPALDLIGRMDGGGWYCRSQDRFEVRRVSTADVMASRPSA